MSTYLYLQKFTDCQLLCITCSLFVYLLSVVLRQPCRSLSDSTEALFSSLFILFPQLVSQETWSTIFSVEKHNQIQKSRCGLAHAKCNGLVPLLSMRIRCFWTGILVGLPVTFCTNPFSGALKGSSGLNASCWYFQWPMFCLQASPRGFWKLLKVVIRLPDALLGSVLSVSFRFWPRSQSEFLLVTVHPFPFSFVPKLRDSW